AILWITTPVLLLILFVAIPMLRSIQGVDEGLKEHMTYLPLVERPPLPLKLGVHVSIWEWNDTAVEQVRLAAETGAEVVRVPVSWFLLQEHGKNNFSSWYIDILRDLLDVASQANLTLIFMMAD